MLIVSISGIRGTIGGVQGENLTPFDVVSFATAYGNLVKKKHTEHITVVIGRDARTTGYSIAQLVIETLRSMSIHIIDLGPVPTPTVEMAVAFHQAQGGIIITASHNPAEYNGIKLLNNEGEFLSEEDGKELLQLKDTNNIVFSEPDDYGIYQEDTQALHRHIKDICNLEIIKQEVIRKKKYTFVVDGINSVGGLAIPLLLEQFNILYIPLHCDPHGNFAHMPEPLEKNLFELKEKVRETGADGGIAVDPDSDRLVLVDEQGNMFGEEYTLVAASDYVLSQNKGPVVTNLSSSRALFDLAKKYGVPCHSSKVGEKNVVELMKEVSAVVGGEGSGGVIYPPLHYGRDALVGVALILSLLAERGVALSELKKDYTTYYMAKEKIELDNSVNTTNIFEALAHTYNNESITTIDGLKIDFEESWVHLRASNTEPILRVYTEAKTQDEADTLAQRIISEINAIT